MPSGRHSPIPDDSPMQLRQRLDRLPKKKPGANGPGDGGR